MIFGNFIYTLPMRYWSWNDVALQLKKDHSMIVQEARLLVRDNFSKISYYECSSDILDNRFFSREKIEAREFLYASYYIDIKSWDIQGGLMSPNMDYIFYIADLIVEIEDLERWAKLDQKAQQILLKKKSLLERTIDEFLLYPILPFVGDLLPIYSNPSTFAARWFKPTLLPSQKCKDTERQQFMLECISQRPREIDKEKMIKSIGLVIEFSNGTKNHKPSDLSRLIASLIISFLG